MYLPQLRTLLCALIASVPMFGWESEASSTPSFESDTHAAATFSILDSDLPDRPVIVAYGDIRFTNPHETDATRPNVRQALVQRVADEHPSAVFLNGDLPWHATTEDYGVYVSETAPWREQHLRVYPTLGDDEFEQCSQTQCLKRWWTAFPALRGYRWYSVGIGSKVLGIVLDSNSSLLGGSAQRQWLERQIKDLAPSIKYVLIFLHHPPLADVQTTKLVDHNPRPNEQALAEYLSSVAPKSRTRFLVAAADIHNYERLERDRVVYLVSGGGGAEPNEIDRADDDLYDQIDFPNYHYVRLTLLRKRLVVEMIRLRDYAADSPAQWEVRDRIDLD